MLCIVDNVNIFVQFARDGIDKGRQWTIAITDDVYDVIPRAHRAFEAYCTRRVFDFIILQHQSRLVQISVFKHANNIIWCQLCLAAFGFLLNDTAKVNLRPTRQMKTKVTLQDISNTAFTWLAIDTHDILIAASDISRVNRQVRHIP